MGGFFDWWRGDGRVATMEAVDNRADSVRFLDDIR